MVQTYDPILPLRRLHLHNAPSLLWFSNRNVYANARAKIQRNLRHSLPLENSALTFFAIKLQPAGQVLSRFHPEKMTCVSYRRLLEPWCGYSIKRFKREAQDLGPPAKYLAGLRDRQENLGTGALHILQ